MKYTTNFDVTETEELEVLSKFPPMNKERHGRGRAITITITLNTDGHCVMESEHLGFAPDEEHFEGRFDERERLGVELALLMAARHTQKEFRANQKRLDALLRKVIGLGDELLEGASEE